MTCLSEEETWEQREEETWVQRALLRSCHEIGALWRRELIATGIKRLLLAPGCLLSKIGNAEEEHGRTDRGAQAVLPQRVPPHLRVSVMRFSQVCARVHLCIHVHMS